MMNFANQQFINTVILYSIVVVLPYLILCYNPLKALAPWKMNLGAPSKKQNNEILLTLGSFLILYGTLLLNGFLQDQGVEVFQKDLSTLYYVLSFPLVVLVHDAYFYWTHYLMHKSKFMYKFHKAHHGSADATPLDVFAFHPVEAFIHFIFFLLYPLLIPTTLPVMQFMFIWMIVCNSAGHLPYEFYPKYLYDFPIIKQFNAATHHQMHHKYYHSNFSIYYNWWDRWMGTNHKKYFETFKKVKSETESTLEKKSSPAAKTLLR